MFFELVLPFPALAILFNFDKKLILLFPIKFKLCAFNFEFTNFKFCLRKFTFFSTFFSSCQVLNFIWSISLIHQCFCYSIVRPERCIGPRNSVSRLFQTEIAWLSFLYLKSSQWSMKTIWLTMTFSPDITPHN